MPVDWDSDEEKEKAPKEDEGMISQTAKVVGDMGSSMAKGALHGLEAIEHGLGAEDFAELLRDVPGMMVRLGVAGPEGCAPLHNGAFALEEDALGVGIAVLTATVLAWITENTSA